MNLAASTKSAALHSRKWFILFLFSFSFVVASLNLYISFTITEVHKESAAIDHLQNEQTSLNLTIRRHNVHVVVSHCDKSVGWIWRRLANGKNEEKWRIEYNLKSATILTKCNVTIESEDLEVPMGNRRPVVQVVSLPNVGRCDHSYAYWITEVLKGYRIEQNDRREREMKNNLVKNEANYEYKDRNENIRNETQNSIQQIAQIVDKSDLVLFLKDNDNAYRAVWNDFSGLLDVLNQLTVGSQTATSYSDLKRSGFSKSITPGIACQSYPNSNFLPRWIRHRYKMTNLAHRSVLWTFRMDSYAREDRDSKSADRFYSADRPMGAWIQHLADSGNTFSRDFYALTMDVVKVKFKFYYNATHEGLKVLEDRRSQYNTMHYKERDLIPICLGGVFATYWGQIASQDAPLTLQGWQATTRALSRADNLEEGHYMERWWGDLFSWSSYATNILASDIATNSNDEEHIPFTLGISEQNELLEDKLRHMEHTISPYAGMLVLDRNKLEGKKSFLF